MSESSVHLLIQPDAQLQVRLRSVIVLEQELVMAQTAALLAEADVSLAIAPDVIELLVTTFHDLRQGRTDEGTVVDRPSTVMSTAEAVVVGVSAGLDAHYLGDGTVTGDHIVRHLVGTVLKDNPEDAKKLKHYFSVVVKGRAQKHSHPEAFPLGDVL